MGIPSTIEYPYTCNQGLYETDNIKLTSNHMNDTSNSPGGLVQSLAFKDTLACVKFGYPGNVTITYEFKNGIKVNPNHLYIYASLNQSHYTMSISTYVWDEETQSDVRIYNAKYSPNNGLYGCVYDKALSTPIMTSKIKTVISCRDTVLYYLIYDFDIDSTSKMIKNKVTAAIMQNELWIKHTSNADIDNGIEVAIVSDEIDEHIYEPGLNAEAAKLVEELNERGE